MNYANLVLFLVFPATPISFELFIPTGNLDIFTPPYAAAWGYPVPVPALVPAGPGAPGLKTLLTKLPAPLAERVEFGCGAGGAAALTGIIDAEASSCVTRR